MTLETYLNFCLSLKGAEESFPFDEQVLVFKVKGKIFALANIESFDSINLKCLPEKAAELRETYPEVLPGYHMSKKHWNTVQTGGRLPDRLICEWIRDSYDLVVAGLPRKLRQELEETTD